MKISSIKTWPKDDRPREKLLNVGASMLSAAELMAILLGSGTTDESAVDLSKKILNQIGGLPKLQKKELSHFITFKGVGEAKAVRILAALELGKRCMMSNAEQVYKITSSRSAYEIMGPILQDLPIEEFWIMNLNRRNHLISKTCISKGGIAGTVVDPKVIFKKALDERASSIILFHNHPSGEVSPSTEDLKITLKLKKAGELLDINVLDHLIIGTGQYFSFADEGRM
jgi:DNA repair protein RadC